MENGSKNKKKSFNILREKKVQKQFMLYIVFAVFMIILNLIIQHVNLFFAPIICKNLGNIELIRVFYCSDIPIRMSEFVGQVLAVGITVIIKFLLDKFFVFKTLKKIKETSREFTIYFIFSILATLWNIGAQLVLSNIFHFYWFISAIIALTTGYILRFFLDRKYTFKKFESSEK